MRRSVDRQTRTAPNGGAGRVLSALRRLRGERGAAMVEFALVLPLLALLLVGMLEFGRALNYWIDTTHMASEGARLAAVSAAPAACPGGGAAGNLAQYVQCQADTHELRYGGTTSVPDPASVCIDFPNGTTNRGDPVRVTVTATFNWLPLIGAAGGVGSTTITGAATMRLESDWTGGGGICS